MKPFAVFKAGLHKDSKGNKKNWTIKEIDTACEKYNNQEATNYHEAPIVIGHPKDNKPSFGWIKRFFREGDIMFAEPRQIYPEFKEWVEKGLFKTRSISFYPDLLPRHVGFLGATPPAIKGLPAIEFGSSDNEIISFEFSEEALYYSTSNKFSTISNILRRIKNFLIEEKDVEKADSIINEWDIKEIERELPKPEPIVENVKNFGEVVNIDGIEPSSLNNFKEDTLDPKEQEKLQKQISDFAEENKLLKQRLEEVEKKEKESQKNDFKNFCESLKKEGKITPVQESKILDFAEIIGKTGNFEFSENNGKVSKDALSEFKEFLKTLPKQVDFGETATNSNVHPEAKTKTEKNNEFSEFAEADVDEEKAALDKKAKKIMKDQKVSYAEALKIAMKEDK